MTTFLHHDGALGDVLLSLPCVRRMVAEGGPVHFTGRDDIGTLLRESGLASEISSAAGARCLSLHTGTADPGARAFLEAFDRAYVITVDPDGPLVAAVRSVIPATHPIRSIPPEGSLVHVARFRLEQLGSAAEDNGPLLPVPSLHRELAARMLARAGYDGSRKVLAVHPGSGSTAKNWPVDRYLAVLEACASEADPFVVLFSGPAEDDRLKDRMDDMVRHRSGWAHYSAADLSAVAALLCFADLYLGNDSGVSHLAAAVGCRAIVLYGPTDPDRWRPVGAPVEVVRSRELGEIPAEDVAARVLQALGREDSASGDLSARPGRAENA